MPVSSPRKQLRSAIIKLHEAGLSGYKIMKQLGVSKNVVYSNIRKYAETDSTKDRARSGRPRSARTLRLQAKVKQKINRNLERSMRQMAKEHRVGRETIAPPCETRSQAEESQDASFAQPD